MLFVLLVLFSCVLLQAQENHPVEEDNIDALFEQEEPPANKDNPPAEPDLLEDLGLKKGVLLGAEFYLMAGYSPGINAWPWDVDDPSDLTYMDAALFKLSASVDANVRFSPEFRMYTKITGRFPELVPEITELFCDYNFLNSVFFRIGRQAINWGISPNYPFTNLLGRVPEDYVEPTEERADSIGFKMNIPFGIGGLEVVMFSREEFWGDSNPTVHDIGMGATFNLALAGIDFSLGGFFHEDLNHRSDLILFVVVSQEVNHFPMSIGEL